jgi:hypothetical protein
MSVTVWKTTVKVLFTRNLSLKDKQLINSIIMMSLNNSEKGFIMSGQRLRTLGCCITTSLCQTAISVNEFLTKKGTSVVLQPPHLPDLSPHDFFLFLKLKFHLKGGHFGTVDNIQKGMTDHLRALPHEEFQHFYQEREQRLQWCLGSQKNYFEGDNVDL